MSNDNSIVFFIIEILIFEELMNDKITQRKISWFIVFSKNS